MGGVYVTIYMDFLTVKEIAQGHERMEKSPLISAPIKKYRVANKKKNSGGEFLWARVRWYVPVL